tara:strand:- start:143 stop:481 length:339 start_codon:yes stop_codon:yes gene_type:complete
MSRYVKRRILVNKTKQYKEDDIFENRGVQKISQHITPRFKSFTREQYNSVPYVRHYWTNGDRYWKLANQYYNDPTLWWIIARWNFAPTESHLEEGQEIRIPTDLQRTLELIR